MMSMSGMFQVGALLLFALSGAAQDEGKKPADEKRRVGVRVTDAQGNPVAGAAVEVIAGYLPATSAVTARDGLALLEIPLGLTVQWVVALKPGSGLDYFENYVSSPMPAGSTEDLPELIDLRLDGARKIEIEARDAAGDVVAGIRFVPWRLARPDKKWFVNLSGSEIAAVATNPGGTAVFDWLPREVRSPPDIGSTFLVQGDDYYWPDPPEEVLCEADAKTVTARVLRTVTISGSVFLPSGRPAANIVVQAEGRGDTFHFCRAITRTAADGFFALKVDPEQSYTLCAWDDKHVAQELGIEVGAAQRVPPIVLRMEPGILLEGLMTDDAGKPVVGELVLLAHEDPNLALELQPRNVSGARVPLALVRRALTDARGRYSFSVLPGKYWYGVVGGTPSAVHDPAWVIADAEEKVRIDAKQNKAKVWGFTAAPVKANRPPVSDYGFVNPPGTGRESCRACHRM